MDEREKRLRKILVELESEGEREGERKQIKGCKKRNTERKREMFFSFPAK